MINPMVGGHTITSMALIMRVSGSKINNMEKGRRCGLMDLGTKVSMNAGKSMGRENLFGQINLNTLESSIIIAFMGRDCTLGLIKGGMMENGRTIK